MNILLTGCAGFVGSHLSERLLANGHNVIGLDDLSGGLRENLAPGVQFYQGDICDEGLVEHIFKRRGVDAVAHAAAFASENLSPNCGLFTANSIVMGTQTLINAAVNHGASIFVNLSSIAVYGEQEPPFTEDTYPQPCDNYGACKLAAEHLLRSAKRHFGLNSVTFRPHNVLGRNQSLADSTRNVASIFIRQALSGQPLTIFGDGEQTRAFSPVSQVAAIIAESVDDSSTWNQTYNVGGDTPYTVNWLASMVHLLSETTTGRKYLPARNESKHAHSSHEKVKRAFPSASLKGEDIGECLKGMIEEARKRPLPAIKPLPRIEIQQNLNPAWTK